ncbi:hypothetical protein B0J11DRAFT_545733 [Dendryphion nanum]|uniref:Heterokaryon incompatibility domain-containing protein n=1 Tax=Dendryphion nanum TaxID=256645 RepID=A0A9P9CXL7_9PLEO|nr:hypothetical protein B0J11DRAFT_545733 [Dendryphion nanum]
MSSAECINALPTFQHIQIKGAMISIQADMGCVSKVYKYQPLHAKRHQIRLLILPTSSNRAIDYHLKTFDFESALQYIALSYTWGEKSALESVTINGRALLIRPILFKFLQTYADAYLWIDQICIYLDRSRTRHCRKVRSDSQL